MRARASREDFSLGSSFFLLPQHPRREKEERESTDPFGAGGREKRVEAGRRGRGKGRRGCTIFLRCIFFFPFLTTCTRSIPVTERTRCKLTKRAFDQGSGVCRIEVSGFVGGRCGVPRLLTRALALARVGLEVLQRLRLLLRRHCAPPGPTQIL